MTIRRLWELCLKVPGNKFDGGARYKCGAAITRLLRAEDPSGVNKVSKIPCQLSLFTRVRFN